MGASSDLSYVVGEGGFELPKALTQQEILEAAKLFDSIRAYRDAEALAETCKQKAEKYCKDAIYSGGKAFIAQGQREEWTYRNRIDAYKTAINKLSEIRGWRDTDRLIDSCQECIAKLEAQDKAQREERERMLAEDAAKEARMTKLRKKAAAIVLAIVCVCVVLSIVLTTVIRR